MSRPAVVYLAMIVVLVGGLWAVLAIGAKLSPPEDLAGKWQLEPGGSMATIEQSGKFFQMSFEHGPLLDLKLHRHSPHQMQLQNADWQVLVTGPAGSDDKTIQLVGSQPGEWKAHRTVRTFPADVSAKEGH